MSFFVSNTCFCGIKQWFIKKLFGSDVPSHILRWNFIPGIADDMLGLV